MDVKLFVWKSEYGTWFLITENQARLFLDMHPILDTAAQRMLKRGVPMKEF